MPVSYNHSCQEEEGATVRKKRDIAVGDAAPVVFRRCPEPCWLTFGRMGRYAVQPGHVRARHRTSNIELLTRRKPFVLCLPAALARS